MKCGLGAKEGVRRNSSSAAVAMSDEVWKVGGVQVDEARVWSDDSNN